MNCFILFKKIPHRISSLFRIKTVITKNTLSYKAIFISQLQLSLRHRSKNCCYLERPSLLMSGNLYPALFLMLGMLFLYSFSPFHFQAQGPKFLVFLCILALRVTILSDFVYLFIYNLVPLTNP